MSQLENEFDMLLFNIGKSDLKSNEHVSGQNQSMLMSELFESGKANAEDEEDELIDDDELAIIDEPFNTEKKNKIEP